MQSIISYCVEYAVSQNSTCASCGKIIPAKSLRCGKVSRSSKRVKKNHGNYTWFHFKCFEVPELLARIGVENFRGYPALQIEDKRRIDRLVALGIGKSWIKDIAPQAKKKPKVASKKDEKAEKDDKDEKDEKDEKDKKYDENNSTQKQLKRSRQESKVKDVATKKIKISRNDDTS